MTLRSSFWVCQAGMLKIGHHVKVGEIHGRIVFFEDSTDLTTTMGIELSEPEHRLCRIEVELAGAGLYRIDDQSNSAVIFTEEN